MSTEIVKPKILVLSNSLGDMTDEADYMDIMELH